MAYTYISRRILTGNCWKSDEIHLLSFWICFGKLRIQAPRCKWISTWSGHEWGFLGETCILLLRLRINFMLVIGTALDLKGIPKSRITLSFIKRCLHSFRAPREIWILHSWLLISFVYWASLRLLQMKASDMRRTCFTWKLSLQEFEISNHSRFQASSHLL